MQIKLERELKLNYLFVFLVFAFFITALITYEKNIKLEQFFSDKSSEAKSQYDAIYKKYKMISTVILRAEIKKSEILELYSRANGASKQEKEKIRDELYKKLIYSYDILKDHNIKQLHFHLPNNDSFLRFHKPSKFGDNLSDIRSTVKYVNQNKKSIDGFEEGRIYNGYRFVYPLSYNKKHIGSVEVSFSTKAMSKEFFESYKNKAVFFIDKDVVKQKVFRSEQSNYIQSSFENYVVEKALKSDLFDLSSKNKKRLQKSDNIKEVFTLYDKKLNGLVSFIPVKNPISKKIVGFFTIKHFDPSYYNNKMNNFYISIVVANLLLAFMLYYLYSNSLSKLRSKEYEKKLEKQKNKAIEASMAKSEFLANMSHEIRTPLNAILGFVSLLKEECIKSKAYEYVCTIESSSKNLLLIIEDILDLSKIENNKLHMENIDFDLYKEIRSIVDIFSARASEKDITITLFIDQKVPRYIKSDPLRIKQVVANLLSNAVKFTPSKKNIKVDVKYIDQKLKISVHDEGIGISKEKLTKIFDAFSQEDSSTTREYGGTGLGLAISSSLVKLLNGELKVESKKDKGSRFFFSIPVVLGDEIKPKEHYSDSISFNMHILLVEDNKTNQMFMKVFLKKLGITYDIANDGFEAIEAFKANRYDFILMDENMPNMNGIEAAKRILKIEKELSLVHTPIIALTANALTGDRERFIDAGMDEYLTKPLDKVKFIEVLRGLFPKNRDGAEDV